MTESPDRMPPPSSPGGRHVSSRTTLWIDRCMTWFVKLGGLATITVVIGIFVFILGQIIPLFRGARVVPARTMEAPARDYRVMGVDEWSEYPFLLSAQGSLVFLDPEGSRPSEEVACPFPATPEWTAFGYQPLTQELALGDKEGRFGLLRVKYQADFASGRRVVRQETVATPLFDPPRRTPSPGPIEQIALAGDDEKIVLAIQRVGERRAVWAAQLRKSGGLLGGGEMVVSSIHELSPQLEATPEHVAVSQSLEHLVVATDDGEVYYFFREGDSITLRQRFRPFHDPPRRTLSSMAFLFGGVSLVLTDEDGECRVWSLYRPRGSSVRLFGQTKQFPSLGRPGPTTVYVPSLRNKAFLVGTASHVSLYFSTTESVRWQQNLPFHTRLAAMSGKYNSLLFLDDKNNLHVYALTDPHPEASLSALFGKVWYEGYDSPQYVWQSTGGTDDFEPKLSMIPLIWGTLKGTLFALLFALPVALLSAVYTSEFLHRRFRVWVKPTMEIMASLPSVVLGFIGALWLAPRLEQRVPSVLLLLVSLPAAALLVGGLWAALPRRAQHWFRAGYEWLFMIPVLLLVAVAAWSLGPTVEHWLCATADPSTGARIADFRYWWPVVTGADFQQRNSLVVGFMMGFAVIPIIFTIAEDSLSNVPYALRSASMALGASRWQTALRVVLPTASPGIFSGGMIGLGRAIGETMIVVMATGNTPILSLNPFNGMRTLSANIAVELPEAPFQGTLYRALFLGALLLFILTFCVNTAAELLRQHLREKYKTV